MLLHLPSVGSPQEAVTPEKLMSELGSLSQRNGAAEAVRLMPAVSIIATIDATSVAPLKFPPTALSHVRTRPRVSVVNSGRNCNSCVCLGGSSADRTQPLLDERRAARLYTWNSPLDIDSPAERGRFEPSVPLARESWIRMVSTGRSLLTGDQRFESLFLRQGVGLAGEFRVPQPVVVPHSGTARSFSKSSACRSTPTTGSGVVEALIRAEGRGVDVRLIADKSTPCGQASGFEAGCARHPAGADRSYDARDLSRRHHRWTDRVASSTPQVIASSPISPARLMPCNARSRSLC